MVDPIRETPASSHWRPVGTPVGKIAPKLLVLAGLSFVACSHSSKIPKKTADTRTDLREATLSSALKNDQMQMQIDNADLQGGAVSDNRLLIDRFLVDADQKAQLIAKKIEDYASLSAAGKVDQKQAVLISRADQMLDGFLDACRMWAKDARTLEQARDGCSGLTSLAAEVLPPSEQK